MNQHCDIIINLSAKKVGTSFLHSLFHKNFSKLSNAELFVPAFKEWFFVPRNTKNFKNLAMDIVNFHSENKFNLSTNDINFLLRILAYESTGFSRRYFETTKLVRSTNSKKKCLQLYGELVNECWKRFDFIHENVINKYKSIYLSDTNFSETFLMSTGGVENMISKKFDSISSPVFFALIRNPLDAVISLLKTFPLEFIKSKKGQTLPNTIKRYDQFSLLKRFMLNANIPTERIILFDFDFFVKNTGEAFNFLLDYLNLNIKKNIVIPENPNPSENKPEVENYVSAIKPEIEMQVKQNINLEMYDSLKRSGFLILKK